MENKDLPATNRLESQFRLVWDDILTNIKPDDLLGMPTLKKWWPTISHMNELDWPVMVENYMALPHNPVAAIIHVYVMGMVRALEGIEDESILPLLKEGEDSIPDWLQTAILEDIFLKYGENH